jgi:DNA modification methylase
MTILAGDAYERLDELTDKCIDLCFTSPNPFRFENAIGIGSENTTTAYFTNLIRIFNKVKRVLDDRGSLWVHMVDLLEENSGNMMMIPERFAFFMQMNKWIVRSKLIWHRKEDFPRTDFKKFKTDWEPIYVFTKQKDTYFKDNYGLTDCSMLDFHAKSKSQYESGFPEGIVGMAIDITCIPGGTVLDPFCGSGVTGKVALDMLRSFIGIELSESKANRTREKLYSSSLNSRSVDIPR